MKTRLIILIIGLCAAFAAARAQEIVEIMNEIEDTNGTENEFAIAMELHVEDTEYKGQVIPLITYPGVYKYAPLTFKNEKEKAKMDRLIRNVKRLLPLAKMARLTIIETTEYINTLPNDKARAAHLKQVEKGLWKEYEPTFKKMSTSQGRLFVKLLDRECGTSAYNIINAFMGAGKANASAALGWFYGIKLTKKYDPTGDDAITERICRMVENGQL